MARFFIALVHQGVYNKRGERVDSSVTTMDLHDLARCAATYEAARFYVVTPLADQAALVSGVVSHWREGHGRGYNPARARAMERVEVAASLEEALENAGALAGERPVCVATAAREGPGRLGYGQARRLIVEGGRPFMLLFGTAWGLTEETLAACDHVLSPIRGRADYNHLSVRTAAGIVLDRLLGDRS